MGGLRIWESGLSVLEQVREKETKDGAKKKERRKSTLRIKGKGEENEEEINS